jgi:hypothetical protein
LNQTELAEPARKGRARGVATEPERVTARVTVAWTPSKHGGPSDLAPAEIELVSRLNADSNCTWICAPSFGSNWLEAISSAHCQEVVLTARIGNDMPAKHLVLELAELLTLELTEGQPTIRVRFLPPANAARGARTHA